MSRLIDADALEPDADYDDGDYWAVSIAQIQNAPTIVLHEPQRWIPVTERLPEEDGEYLVVNRTIKGKPCVYGIDTFANDLYQVDKYEFSDKKGQKGWAYFHDEYGYIEDQTVVAWMPLPDAYKGE